ncbi:MAG: hypothetical protein U1E86_18555 [Burkholderiaceae bacterium]
MNLERDPGRSKLTTPASGAPAVLDDGSAPVARSIDPGVRGFIVAAMLLVGSAAASLLVFPARTEEYFAWTIRPPLTASWLGAGYASAFVALWMTRRRTDWRDVRIGVAVVSTGLVAILVATLLHLDRFHWSSPHLSARLWAWAWLAWYVVLPPVLVVVLLRQRRRATLRPGPARAVTHAPARPPLTIGFRTLAGTTAAAMTLYGAILFLAPALAGDVWPWPLTPLTARMIGAWWIGVAVALAAAARSEDFGQVRVAAPAFVLYAVLQLAQLGLARETLGPAPVLPAVVLLVALLVVGAWAAGAARGP